MDTHALPPSRRRVLTVVAVCLTLLLVSTSANAVMDVISFRYSTSVFATWPQHREWIDPQVSWHRKWKNGDRAQGEAFPFSSTVLVATTDLWHLAKEVMLWTLMLAIILPFTLAIRLHWTAWVGLLVLIKCLYSSTFEMLFAWGLIT